jgi:DNA-directed RNA polymerase subunit alpha
MPVKYGKFEMPTEIKTETVDDNQNYARFIAEPFERGYGHTIGNALRRILLTSLEAPSIISVKIEGVSHEFMGIEGVIEDMTHIVLNIKGAKLRKLPYEEKRDSRDAQIVTKVLDITADMIQDGQYSVRLKDIVGDCTFDLVNPDHLIFTATKPMTREIRLKIAIGRGYVPAERHIILDKVADEIVIDSSFSPVTLVDYTVEHTRVGQDTDFDRLVLGVHTDGRIKPQEALSFATQVCISHFKVFEELNYLAITFDNESAEEDSDRDGVYGKLGLKINEIELSVRSTNCLAQANIDSIAELIIMPESEMLKFRNFGKKSLNEIKEKLEQMGLYLGMDLSRYGITRDNVKEMVKELQKDKVGNTEA